MYEENGFAEIQERMLGRISENVDKREGSIIWDATATVSYGLAEMYFLLANYADLILPDTSGADYLDRLIYPFGVERKQASKALRKVTTSVEITVGSRWQLQDTTYVITALTGPLEYAAECEQEGSRGNMYYGILGPLDNGTSAEAVLGEVLSAGTDTETDEALRERFLKKVRRPSTSGNANDYYNWAMECDGVGAARVFPLADGPGTVKVVITDENGTAADAALAVEVYDHIESLRPIGANVTVVPATEVAINISAGVSLMPGVNLGSVQDSFRKAVETYLHDRALEAGYISLARIGNLLLDVSGVDDYGELLLNGVAGNAAISSGEVAITGEIRLEVM